MKNKSVIFFLSSLLLILFILLGVYKYSNVLPTVTLSLQFPYFTSSQKEFTVDGKKVLLIDNSDQVDIKINDKNKLEQIVRRYPSLFVEPYQAIRIILSDDLQDIGFSWASGTPFSYSVFLHTIPYIDITLQINRTVLTDANWDTEMVSLETEGQLINALERAVMNINPKTATTRTDAEESTKSKKIEASAQQAFDQLSTDNPNQLFTVLYE